MGTKVREKDEVVMHGTAVCTSFKKNLTSQEKGLRQENVELNKRKRHSPGSGAASVFTEIKAGG